MSRIIKSSQITGEYILEDNNYFEDDEIDNNKDKNIMEESASAVKSMLEEEEIKQSKVVLDAEKRAEEIIKEAEIEAEKLRNQLKQELEETRQQAYDQGYTEGLKAGKKDGHEQGLTEFKNLLTFFDNIVTETKKELDQDINDLQQDVIKLAVKIAGHIVSAQLKIKPETINNIISEMIGELVDIDELQIHINADLLQYIDKDYFKTEYVKKTISFIGDNKLEPGDCIIETYFGGKDGTLENKLKIMENELLEGAGFHEKARPEAVNQ